MGINLSREDKRGADISIFNKENFKLTDKYADIPPEIIIEIDVRAEVEDLKAMLGSTDAHLPLIEDRMRSVHALSDRASVELRADGIRVGIFLSEIGRMLGLD